MAWAAALSRRCCLWIGRGRVGGRVSACSEHCGVSAGWVVSPTASQHTIQAAPQNVNRRACKQQPRVALTAEAELGGLVEVQGVELAAHSQLRPRLQVLGHTQGRGAEPHMLMDHQCIRWAHTGGTGAATHRGDRGRARAAHVTGAPVPSPGPHSSTGSRSAPLHTMHSG